MINRDFHLIGSSLQTEYPRRPAEHFLKLELGGKVMTDGDLGEFVTLRPCLEPGLGMEIVMMEGESAERRPKNNESSVVVSASGCKESKWWTI